MEAEKKLTIVLNGNKAFLETDKVSPYAVCKCRD
jgi:hypothetical protein